MVPCSEVENFGAMAANNYFGFTHGGTQYSPQPASAYPTAQTAYVQPAHQTAYATAAPRAAQTYDTYPTAHPTGQYAYAATRTQPAASYDASKAYYAPAAPTAAAATAVYTVAETPTYQAAKPAYSTTTYTAPTQHRQPTAAKTPAHSTTSSYVYPNTTTAAAPSSSTYVTTSSTNYSGYDAALYSAATSYYQQQQAAKTGSAWPYKKGATAAVNKAKPKQPPKQPQLHYCEVCKISCAGPQTYREHLEGQKHKKKEAAMKTGGTTSTGRGQNQLRCELCDVSCTGADAYAAHIRGAKHQKVLKLHTKLGKPIPSTDPVVVAANSSSSTAAKTSTTSTGATTKTVTTAAAVRAGTSNTVITKKIVATPKITFVGGTQLKTTGTKTEEVKTDTKPATTEASSTPEEEKGDLKLLLADKDVVPVGQEYIEEIKNEAGKTVSFNCKLCECKFNDPNAKEMHMKGRRHRLQYKKKVDPSLQVEVKPSIRARKLQEDKLRRQAAKEEYWRRRDAEERWREEMRYMMEEDHYYMGRGYGRGMPGFGGPMPGMPMRRPDTLDDRHVMAKHTSIYPTEAELQAVQNIVSTCEKALKLVSDHIAETDAPKPMETTAEKTEKVEKKIEVKKEKEAAKSPVKEDPKDEEAKDENGEDKDGDKKDDPQAAPRALKGVMRVGVLAKGLLLHGDLNVQLVLLCSEKPTRTLMERVADNLPKQIANICEEKFDVKMCVEEAAIIVSVDKEPKAQCTITLTSPVMREENVPDGESVTVKDPPDVLDRHKCLEALAALRHAKWFQARANGLQSCVVVIRILRDLCRRVPTWTPLTQWAMELLVEKCVSSGGANMSPGDALRRVFECIASGILLPAGPGLYDPCEKEPTDATASLSPQEREDITASAQHALRLIAFRQIHKVLGMDALPAPRFQRGQRFNPRKRRRTNSTGEGESEAGDGKKDKKEEEEGENGET